MNVQGVNRRKVTELTDVITRLRVQNEDLQDKVTVLQGKLHKADTRGVHLLISSLRRMLDPRTQTITVEALLADHIIGPEFREAAKKGQL